MSSHATGSRIGDPIVVAADGEEIERRRIDDNGDGAADRAVGYVYAAEGGPGAGRPAKILFYDDGPDDAEADRVQHIAYHDAGSWASFAEDADGDGDLERRSTYAFEGTDEVRRLWESDADGDGVMDTFHTFDVALDRAVSRRRNLDANGDGKWDRVEVETLDGSGRPVRVEFHDWDGADPDLGAPERIEHIAWDPDGGRWASFAVDADGDGDLERRSTYMYEGTAEAGRVWESDSDGDGVLDTARTFDAVLGRVVSWSRLLEADGGGRDRILTRALDERGRIVREEVRGWDDAAGTPGALERAAEYAWHDSGHWRTAALDHDGDGNADKHSTFFLADPPPAVRPFSYLKRWKFDGDDDGTFDASRLVDPARGDRVVGESFDLDAAGAFTRQERYTYDEAGFKFLTEFDAGHDGVYETAVKREPGSGDLVARAVWYDGWTDGAALADQTPDRVLTVVDANGDGTGESRRHDTLADDGETVAASLFDDDNAPDGAWERAESYELRDGVMVLMKVGAAAGTDPAAAAPVFDAAEARVYADGVMTQIRFYDDYDGVSGYDALLAGGTVSRVYRYKLGLDGDGRGDDARYDTMDGAGRTVESLFDIDADGVDRAEAYELDAAGRRTETRFYDAHAGTFDLAGLTPDRIHRHGYSAADPADPDWLSFSRDDDGDGNAEYAASRTFHPGGGRATRLASFDDGSGGGTADDGAVDRRTLETFDALGALVSTRYDDNADGVWDRTVDSTGSRRLRYDDKGRVVLAEFDENGDGTHTRAEAYRYGDGGLKAETVYYDENWLLEADGSARALALQTPDRRLTVEDANRDGTGESRRHDTLADDGATVAASLFDTDNDPNGYWERAEAYERRDGVVVLVKTGAAGGADPKTAAPVFDAAETRIYADGAKTQVRFYDRYDGASGFDALAAGTPGRVYHYLLELDGDGSDDARYDKLDGTGRTVESLFDTDADGPDRAEAYVLDSGGRRTEIRFHDSWTGTFDLAGLTPDRIHRFGYDVGDSSDPDWLAWLRDDNGDGNFERSVSRAFHPGGGVATRLSSFDDGAGGGTAEDGAADRRTLESFDAAGALESVKHDDDNDGLWDRIEDDAGARRYTRDGEGRIVLIEHDGDADGVYTRAEAWTWDGAGKSRIDFYDEGGWDAAPGAANTPDRVYRYLLELDADGSDDARYDTLDAAGRIAESLFDADADGVDRAEAYARDAAGRTTEIRFHDAHTGTFDLAGLTPDRIHRFGYDADPSEPDWLTLARDEDGDGNAEYAASRAFHAGGGVATRLASFDDGKGAGPGGGAADDGAVDRRTLESFDASGALASVKHDDDNDGLWDRAELPGPHESPGGSRTADTRRDTLDADGRVVLSVFGEASDAGGRWAEEHSYGPGGKIRTDFHDRWTGADGPPDWPARSEHFGKDRNGDGTADTRRDTLDADGRVVLSVFEDGAGGGTRAESYAYGTTDADRDRVVRTAFHDDWPGGGPDGREDVPARRTDEFFYDNGSLFASRYRRLDADGHIVERGWDLDNDGEWDWVETYVLGPGGRVDRASFDTDGDGAAERIDDYIYGAGGEVTEVRRDLDADGHHPERVLVHTRAGGEIASTAFHQARPGRVLSETPDWVEVYTRDGEGRVVRVDYHDDGDASGTPDRIELYTLDGDGMVAGARFFDGGDASGTPDATASYAWNVPVLRTVFDSADEAAAPHRWIELRLRDGTFLGTLSDPLDDGVDDTVDFSGSKVGFGPNAQLLDYNFRTREGSHSSGTYDFLPRRLNEPPDPPEGHALAPPGYSRSEPNGLTIVGPPTDWLLRGPPGDDTIVLTRAVDDATAELEGFGADEYVFPTGGTGSSVRIINWQRYLNLIRIDENLRFEDLDVSVRTARYGDSTIFVGPDTHLVLFHLKAADFAFGDADVVVEDADGDGAPEARTVRRYRGELTASERVELDFDDDGAVDRVLWRAFDPDGRFAASLTDRDADGEWDAAVSRLLGSGGDVRVTRFADALEGGAPPASWDRVERHAFRAGRPVLTEFDDDGDGGFERAEAYAYDAEGRTVRVAFHDAWDDARPGGQAPDRIHHWVHTGARTRSRREDNDADGAADIVYHVTADAEGRPARAAVDDGADGSADRAERYRYFSWDSPFEGELERTDFHDNGPDDASANRHRRHGDDGRGARVLVEKGFDADGDGAGDWTETYTAFDAEGRVAAVSYDVDGDGAADRADRILRDSAGRPAEVRRDLDGDGAIDRVLVHTWTFGRISETAAHLGGARKPAPDWVEAYVRDGEGRVVRVDYHDDGDAAGAPDRVEEYKLDADGLIVQARFHDDGDAATAPDATADYEWNDPAAGGNPPVVVDPLDPADRPHRWIVLRDGADAVGKLGGPRLDGADGGADFRGAEAAGAVPAGVIPRLLNQARQEPLTIFAPSSFTVLHGTGLDEVFVLPADKLDGGGQAPTLVGGGGDDVFALDPGLEAADGLRIRGFAPGGDRLRYTGAADADGDGDTDFDDLRAVWSGAGASVTEGGFAEYASTRIELPAGGPAVVLEGVAWRSQLVGGRLVTSSELGPEDAVFPGGARAPAGPLRHGFDERRRVALTEFDDSGDGTHTRAEAYRYGARSLVVETTYWDDWDQDAPRSAQVRDRTLTVADANGDGTGESRRHDAYAGDGETVAESLFDADNDPAGGWDRAEAYGYDDDGRLVLIKTDPAVEGADPRAATVDYAGGRAELRVLDAGGARTEVRFFDDYDGSSDAAALAGAVADRVHRLGLDLDGDGSDDDDRHDRLDERGRTVLSLFDHGADGTLDRAEDYERLDDGRVRAVRFGPASGDDPATATGDWDRGERYTWDGAAGRKTLVEFDDSGDGVHTRAAAYEYGAGDLKTKTAWYDDWALEADGKGKALADQTIDRALTVADDNEDGAGESRRHDVYDEAGAKVVRSLFDEDNAADGSWERAEGYERDAAGRLVLEKTGSADGTDPDSAEVDYGEAAIHILDAGGGTAETRFFDDYDGSSDFAALKDGTADRVHHFGLDLDGDGGDARYDTLDAAGRAVESLFDIGSDGATDRAEAHDWDGAGRRTETRFHDSWTGTFDLSGASPDRIHRWTYGADAADGRWRVFTEDADGDGDVDSRQIKTYGAGGEWESTRFDLDDDGTWDRTETHTWRADGGPATRLTAFDDGRLGGTADDGDIDIRRLDTFDAAGRRASAKFDHDGDDVWDETWTYAYGTDGRIGTKRTERDDGSGGGTADDGKVDSVEIEAYDAAGRVASVQVDHNNNGTWDREETIVRGADGVISMRIAAYDDGSGGGTADDGDVDRTQLHRYDADGREVSVHYNDDDDGRVDRTRSYAYDEAGRRTSDRRDDDNDGTYEETTTWTRRADGRIATERTEWDDGSGGGTADDGDVDATRLRAWDEAGRLTRAGFDDDGDGVEDRAAEYEYGAGDLKVRTVWRGDWTSEDGGGAPGGPPVSRVLTVEDPNGDGTGDASREDLYDAGGEHVARSVFDDDLDGTDDRAEVHELDGGGRRTRTAFHDDYEGTAGETPDRVHVWTYDPAGPDNAQWATWSKNDNAGTGNAYFEYAARVDKWHGTDENTRTRSWVRIELDDGHGDGTADDGTPDRRREDRYGEDGKLDTVSYDNDGNGSFEYLEQFIGVSTHIFYDTLTRRVEARTDTDGDGSPDRVSLHAYAGDSILSPRTRTEIHEDWDGTTDVRGRPPDRIHIFYQDLDGDGASDDARYDRLEDGETVESLFDFDSDRTLERAERHAWSVHDGAARKDLSEFFDAYGAVRGVGADPADLDPALTADRAVAYFYDNGPGDTVPNRYHERGPADGDGARATVGKGFDTDGDGAIDWVERYAAFDDAGRVIRVIYDTEGHGLRIDEFGYDNAGRLIEVRRDEDGDGAVDRIAARVWDTAGDRIAAVAHHEGAAKKAAPDRIEVRSYDEDGRLVRTDHHDDGATGDSPDRVELYTPDEDGLIVRADFYDDGKTDANRDGAVDEADETVFYVWNEPAADGNPLAVFDSADDAALPHRWILLQVGGTTVGRLSDPRFDGGHDLVDFRGLDSDVDVSDAVIPRTLDEANARGRTVWFPAAGAPTLTASDAGDVFIFSGKVADVSDHRTAVGGAGADAFILHDTNGTVRIRNFDPAGGDAVMTSISERYFFSTFTSYDNGGTSIFGGTNAPPSSPEHEGGGRVIFYDTHPEIFGDWEPAADREEDDYQNLGEPGDGGLGFDNPSYYDRIYVFALSPGALAFDFEF